MVIYPAIDILEGACVRLHRGDYDRVTEYSRDPVAVAGRFADAGAEALHVVDLDGAREGRPANRDIVLEIRRRTRLPLQVGGGVRSDEVVTRYLEAGIDRVILGTAAIRRPEWLGSLVERFGSDRIAASVDVRDGRVLVEGWRTSSATGPEAALEALAPRGVTTVVYTDTTRDGTLTGPDVAGARRFADGGFRTIVAGGIASTEQIALLRAAGVAGVIVGSALYEGALTLEEARSAATGSSGDA